MSANSKEVLNSKPIPALELKERKEGVETTLIGSLTPNAREFLKEYGFKEEDTINTVRGGTPLLIALHAERFDIFTELLACPNLDLEKTIENSIKNAKKRWEIGRNIYDLAIRLRWDLGFKTKKMGEPKYPTIRGTVGKSLFYNSLAFASLTIGYILWLAGDDRIDPQNLNKLARVFSIIFVIYNIFFYLKDRRNYYKTTDEVTALNDRRQNLNNVIRGLINKNEKGFINNQNLNTTVGSNPIYATIIDGDFHFANELYDTFINLNLGLNLNGHLSHSIYQTTHLPLHLRSALITFYISKGANPNELTPETRADLDALTNANATLRENITNAIAAYEQAVCVVLEPSGIGGVTVLMKLIYSYMGYSDTNIVVGTVPAFDTEPAFIRISVLPAPTAAAAAAAEVEAASATASSASTSSSSSTSSSTSVASTAESALSSASASGSSSSSGLSLPQFTAARRKKNRGGNNDESKRKNNDDSSNITIKNGHIKNKID